MEQQTDIKQWYAVCGMLQDKKAAESLTPLKGLISQWYFASIDGERGQSAHALQQCVGLSEGVCSDSAKDALTSALAAKTSSTTGIIVFGSFLVVADVLN